MVKKSKRWPLGYMENKLIFLTINMGIIPLQPIGSQKDYDSSKLKGFDSPTSAKAISFVLDEIVINEALLNGNYNILIFIYGGVNSNSINKIKLIKGAELLWKGLMGPWYIKPLSFLFSGNCGLIKVSDIEIFPNIFTSLMEKSYIGAYFVNDEMEKKITTEVMKKKCNVVVEKFIFEDEVAFGLTIDGDSEYSTSGYFTIVRYSKKCPVDLIRITEKLKLPQHHF